MSQLKVLVTGATGYIAGLLLPSFRERYEVLLVDIRQVNRNGELMEDVEIADLLTAPSSELARLFR